MTPEDKERIEKEAAKYARFNYNNDVVEGAEYRGYIDGATAENERAQQELQAYRDIIKELIPLAQNFASELRWDEEYSGDKVGGKEAQEIVDRANKLIDTVTPT